MNKGFPPLSMRCKRRYGFGFRSRTLQVVVNVSVRKRTKCTMHSQTWCECECECTSPPCFPRQPWIQPRGGSETVQGGAVIFAIALHDGAIKVEIWVIPYASSPSRARPRWTPLLCALIRLQRLTELGRIRGALQLRPSHVSHREGERGVGESLDITTDGI